jgi:predicted DNA-binding transcriptional regulator AlpA
MGEAKAKTTNTRGRGPSKRADPIFITKSEIAQLMGVADTKTIDSWIANGSFPPPHSRPGPRHAVWLRKHWNIFVDTGKWPEAADHPSRP